MAIRAGFRGAQVPEYGYRWREKSSITGLFLSAHAPFCGIILFFQVYSQDLWSDNSYVRMIKNLIYWEDLVDCSGFSQFLVRERCVVMFHFNVFL
jgi:hypothetical protein